MRVTPRTTGIICSNLLMMYHFISYQQYILEALSFFLFCIRESENNPLGSMSDQQDKRNIAQLDLKQIPLRSIRIQGLDLHALNKQMVHPRV
jgi:hypothetical protein